LYVAGEEGAVNFMQMLSAPHIKTASISAPEMLQVLYLNAALYFYYCYKDKKVLCRQFTMKRFSNTLLSLQLYGVSLSAPYDFNVITSRIGQRKWGPSESSTQKV
jgi:hypothetical protein